MMYVRFVPLFIVVIALAGVVAVATTLSLRPGSLFILEAKVSPPTTPSDLEAEFHHSEPTIELSWDAVARADHYRLYRRAGQSDVTLIATPGEESYTDTDIEEGEEYRYFVTSVGVDGLESEPSDDVTVLAVAPTETPDVTPTDESAPPDELDDLETPTPDVTNDATGGKAGLSAAQARVLGETWIDDQVGTSYEIDGTSCAAEQSGTYWTVTCLGTLRGCLGSECLQEFTVCVFQQPRTRDWC